MVLAGYSSRIAVSVSAESAIVPISTVIVVIVVIVVAVKASVVVITVVAVVAVKMAVAIVVITSVMCGVTIVSVVVVEMAFVARSVEITSIKAVSHSEPAFTWTRTERAAVIPTVSAIHSPAMPAHV